MANVIDIRNLTKSYGKNRGIIDVTLSVESGDIFGFWDLTVQANRRPSDPCWVF